MGKASDTIKAGGVGALQPLRLIAGHGQEVTADDFEALIEGLRTGGTPILPAGTEMEVREVRPSCAATGHKLDPDTANYIDGVIATRCLSCGERFEMPWFPGGTGALALRFYAEQALGYLERGDEPPPTVIRALIEAHQKVHADRELVDDSLALYQTLRRVLARQLG